MAREWISRRLYLFAQSARAMHQCPSNKFRTFGLSACALDTRTMPVGSEARITFSVYDSSVPPKSAHETRILRIISPCPPDSGAIHCPNLAQPCGTSPCSVRSAILGRGQADEAKSKFNLHLHSSVTLPVISSPGSVPSLKLSWPCSARPPLELAICGNDTLSCFVHAQTNTLDGLTLRVWAPSSPSIDIKQVCSFSALSLGTCPNGDHTVHFQMFSRDTEVSDLATLNVSLSTPTVSFAVKASVQLGVADAGASSIKTSLQQELRGSSALTNRLLLDASIAIKAMLYSSFCKHAAKSIDVDMRITDKALVTQPSGGIVQVNIAAP
jgi:hypothetical protein